MADPVPYDEGVLATPDGQLLHWEVVGDPDGPALVHLHGGPGSGCTGATRRAYADSGHRAVLLDQRGCGRSLPSAADPATSLAANTTQHQVADLELLREHLGVERWTVVGSSWGVTLGLAYAQSHPHRVRAMVLMAVTAGTRREVEWITQDMGRVFPREWERFAGLVPEMERDDLPRAYARLLADSDPEVGDRAAREWCAWEGVHVSLMPGWAPDPRYDDPVLRTTFARLVTHYWSADHFLPDGAGVHPGMARVHGIPAVLVHGRFDVSGPLDTAWRLHRAWPGSELVVLGDAGHGGTGFAEARRDALAQFRRLR